MLQWQDEGAGTGAGLAVEAHNSAAAAGRITKVDIALTAGPCMLQGHRKVVLIGKSAARGNSGPPAVEYGAGRHSAAR
jgi:hypothetical protein